jgi:hypothetical protein
MKPSRLRQTLRRRARPVVDILEGRQLLSGTWSPVTTASGEPPPFLQNVILLSDGSVLAQTGFDKATNTWIRFTISGAFARVSSVPNSNLQREDFSADVLTDGRVLVLGGEYSGPNNDLNDTNTGEVYDPVANTWSNIANFPEGTLGDAPSEVLSNGMVLVGSINDSNTYIYNTANDTWSQGPSLLNGDTSSEETWVKLPDGGVLSYSIGGNDPQTAERYVPSLNQWVFAGNVPVGLATNAGNGSFSPELGPAIQLPNGQVFWVGATDHTALYTPPTTPTGTGTWAAGPDIPGGLGAFDAPIAVEPNGNVLFNAQVLDGTFIQAPHYFEYAPGTNTITSVKGPEDGVPGYLSFLNRLLVLPDGDLLEADSTSPFVYREDPGTAPQASWAPTISTITANYIDQFTINGTQLNGLTEGSGYGDDAENATNFPLVRFSGGPTGDVYGRTFNWSSTAVATGSAVVSTDFSPPANLASDVVYQIRVVADGIASKPDLFVETGPTDYGVTLQNDPANGDYEVLINGNMAGEYAPGSFGGLVLSLSAATTTVNVRETPANTFVTVSGNPFYVDTINVGDATGVQGIKGQLLLDSPSAFNTVNVSDAGDTAARHVTIGTGADRQNNLYGIITGLAPATISYKLADTASPVSITGGSGADTFTVAEGPASQTINLNTGPGNDTVNVLNTLGGLNLDGGGGHDTVYVGSAGSTAFIQGPVHVADTGGVASLSVDDDLDANNDTVTLGAGQLTGLSPAAISWVPTSTGTGGVNSLKVIGGRGSDAWTVAGTSNFGTGSTLIQTGNGGNSFPTVNVQATTGALTVDGSSAGQNVTIGSTGTLQVVHGAVTVTNSSTAGYTALTLLDVTDTTAHAVALSDGKVTGLAPVPITWKDSAPGTFYGGVAGLILYGGSGGTVWNVATDGAPYFGVQLHTGSGTGKADTVNVKATASPLTIDGGNDVATVNVGSLAPALGGTLANIKAPITVENAGTLTGATRLTLDDSGDAAARTVTLADGSLTGLAPATIQWIDSNANGLGEGGVTSVNVLGGPGGNTWAVPGTGAAVSTTVSSGKGNDSVNVLGSGGPLVVTNPGGSDYVNVGTDSPYLGGTLAGIHGPLSVTGAGATVLTLDNSADTASHSVTLNDDTHGHASLTGLTPSPITWTDATSAAGGGVTYLLAYAGKGNNTVNVLNTGSASDNEYLFPGTGTDGVTVTGATGPLFLLNAGANSSYHFVVNTAADGASVPPGKLSLRAAVGLANFVGTPPDPAVVTFDPTVFGNSPHTITLTAGELAVTGSLNLTGPVSASGTPLLTVSGGNARRVFDVQGRTAGVDVVLKDLTITGGLAGPSALNSPGVGGGVLVNDAGGYATLDTLTLRANNAQVTAAGATAQGGGLAVLGGSVRLVNSTLNGNKATGPNAQGGAAFLGGGLLQLANDTVAANSALGSSTGLGQGGGVYDGRGTLTVTYATVANNTATGATSQGGGLYVAPGVAADLVDSILSGDTAGTGPDVYGTVTVSDHDLVGNASGASGFSASRGDLLGVNPMLSALGNYGGPTQTMPPQPGSPTVGAGDGFGLAPASFTGLVAEWRGDGNAQDATGANSTTAQGGVSYAPGVFGRAFQLDGSTGDLRTQPNPAGLSINSEITVSAWVNPSVLKDDNVILDKTATGDAANYRFGIHGNQLFFYNGSTAVFSTGTVPVNTFTQVAFTLDASTNTLKFSINGALDSTRTVGFGALNGAAVTVGRDVDGRYFQGLLDEVQVYNTTLNAAQMQALYTAGTQSSPPLLDSWKGEGNAADTGGTSNGTFSGSVGYAPGVSGVAFSFNGGNGYVDLGTGADVTGTGAFAVGAWVRTASDGTIISQRDASNFDGEYVLSVVGGKVQWSTFGGGVSGFNVTSNQAVADGRWHFVLAQRLADGTGQVYIDGVLDNSQSAAPVPLGSGFHVYLGEDVRNATLESAPAQFTGQIDEVQIFGGALSPAQVQILADAPYALTHDQRGGARPVDALPDVGAVEYSHGAPSGVDIEVQPSNGIVGQPLRAITVWVVDDSGKAVTDSDQLVTLSIASGPAGARLGGTVTLRAVNGVAIFRGLTLNVAGTYTLRAKGGALAPDLTNTSTDAPKA